MTVAEKSLSATFNNDELAIIVETIAPMATIIIRGV